MKLPPRTWLFVQAIVTVVLLLLLMRTLDVQAMRTLLLDLPLEFYFVSLGIVLLGQIAYAWRWRLLLRAAGASVCFRTVVRQYFVGIFVNNFLPSTVGGDVAKVVYLGAHHGYRTVAASVMIDRLLGLAILAVLATVALWLSPVSSIHFALARIASGLIAVVSVLMLVLAGFGTGGLAARVARFGTRFVHLAERLQRLRLDMAAPLGRPAILVQAGAVVVAYSVAITAIYMRFAAVQHVPVPSFLAMFAVVTATALLSNVPVSLNGLGVREQLHAVLLAPLGMSTESAVAISLLLYAHLLVSSLIGFLFWLRRPVVQASVSQPT